MGASWLWDLYARARYTLRTADRGASRVVWTSVICVLPRATADWTKLSLALCFFPLTCFLAPLGAVDVAELSCGPRRT